MSLRSISNRHRHVRVFAATVWMVALLGAAGCSGDKKSAKTCPSGSAGCPCKEADVCDDSLTCEEGMCRGAVSRGVIIGDARARSCELLLTEQSGGHLLRVSFDDTVQGTFVPERPRVALAFAAKGDWPLEADAIQLLQAEGEGDVDLTKSTCFDAKGVPLVDAKVELSNAK